MDDNQSHHFRLRDHDKKGYHLLISGHHLHHYGREHKGHQFEGYWL